MSRTQINVYACKLRLLQHGLVDEAAVVDTLSKKKGSKKGKDADGSSSEEEDEEDLIAKRNHYVQRVIREAKAAGRLEGLMSGIKNPIASEERRTMVKDFFKELVSIKKCANCKGYVLRQRTPHFFFLPSSTCNSY